MSNESLNVLSPYPPYPVDRPVMFQGWQNLTFLHWQYPEGLIRALLPSGLELDTFEGAAWIGLTPFVLTGLRLPGLPALPFISRFPEMNVRTYVRGPDGERGIWFFSLEAHRVAAVAGARLFYGLPYRWAAMSVRLQDAQIEYRSRRHAGTGEAHIIVRIGAPIHADERAVFLTARYRLYTLLAGRLAFAQVEHPPWELQSATVLRLNQNVIERSGVPAPSREPLVHFSRGVYVRVGRPRFAS
ncbi:MAG TPA: DUF2071 domain-containing protein [Bryobacteraceae bacterium]|nr:DUF2071 domain-containing protein [Bryobacteraceae bacterium]